MTFKTTLNENNRRMQDLGNYFTQTETMAIINVFEHSADSTGLSGLETRGEGPNDILNNCRYMRVCNV